MAVEAGGIGARLRAGREKLGLTILQASERLHTDARILDALEADDFAVLGAPVYARGHIRHYAELVGESPTELNALYANLNKVAQPDLTQIAKAPPSDNSSKLIAPALLVIGVFAIAGAIWWVSALSKKEPRLSDTHVVGSSDAQSQSESGAGQGATPGALGSDANGTATDGTGSDTGANGATAAQNSNALASQGRSGGAGTTAAQGRMGAQGGASSSAAASGRSAAAGSANSAAMRSTNSGAHAGSSAASAPISNIRTAAAAGGTAPGSARTATVGGAAAPAPASATGTVASNAGAPHSKHDATVTLRYSADSWTEVYDASGTRLFYDVGAANTVQSFSGTYPLRVVLGNASGVSVEFNGHHAPIASLLHPDGSAQFSINRSGRVVRARPVADGG
jgi:cytoskeleton protein RodZ